MLKKIILIITLSLVNILLIDLSFAEVWNNTIKDALIDTSENNVIWWTVDDGDWITMLAWIFNWLKTSMQSLILIVSIAVFLYIWTKLAFARWNAEEFKKAMIHFVYAIIWIFIVAIAWATVKMVAWINL